MEQFSPDMINIRPWYDFTFLFFCFCFLNQSVAGHVEGINLIHLVFCKNMVIKFVHCGQRAVNYPCNKVNIDSDRSACPHVTTITF